jgi:hypothetical protein
MLYAGQLKGRNLQGGTHIAHDYPREGINFNFSGSGDHTCYSAIAILILTEVTSKFHAKKRLLQYMNSVFSGSLIYRTVLDRCMPCRIHVVMPLYPDNQKGR